MYPDGLAPGGGVGALPPDIGKETSGMGERENLVQVTLSVLEGLELIEELAQGVLDRCAEEKAVLEGVMLLAGGCTYRQKKLEKGVEKVKNGCKIGENGSVCKGVAV